MDRIFEIIKNNKKYFLSILVIICVGIILIFLSQTKVSQETKKAGQEKQEKVGESKSTTWTDIPFNIEVPTPESQNLPENVAKPKNVSQASAISDSSIRNFSNLVIENNSFKPDTFIVKQGDIFDVFVVAKDKNYDFTQPDYGYTLKINKGETKRVQFQASATGKFVFYCQLCGGPDKGPKGYLIVAPKQ